MSRSFRKNLFGFCCRMKEWKREQNRKLRRKNELGDRIEEIPNYSHFKKINDIWGSPSDGKMRLKSKRK